MENNKKNAVVALLCITGSIVTFFLKWIKIGFGLKGTVWESADLLFNINNTGRMIGIRSSTGIEGWLLYGGAGLSVFLLVVALYRVFNVLVNMSADNLRDAQSTSASMVITMVFSICFMLVVFGSNSSLSESIGISNAIEITVWPVVNVVLCLISRSSLNNIDCTENVDAENSRSGFCSSAR